jgi:hypothetical protein
MDLGIREREEMPPDLEIHPLRFPRLLEYSQNLP